MASSAYAGIIRAGVAIVTIRRSSVLATEERVAGFNSITSITIITNNRCFNAANPGNTLSSEAGAAWFADNWRVRAGTT